MTKLEKIAAVKKLYDITNSFFTIPDNCVGDGWKGSLCESGAYLYGTNDFDGEYVKYEDMDESVLDTILDEAEFEHYDFDDLELSDLLQLVEEECSTKTLLECVGGFVTDDDELRLFLLDCITTKRNNKG